MLAAQKLSLLGHYRPGYLVEGEGFCFHISPSVTPEYYSHCDSGPPLNWVLEIISFSLYPHMAEKEQASSVACSYRGTYSICEDSTLVTSSSPKDPAAKNHHTGS